MWGVQIDMRKPIYFSEEQLETMKSMYVDGYKIVMIAVHFDVSVTVIRDRLRRMCVNVRRWYRRKIVFTKSQKEEMKHMYLVENKSMDAISEHMGCSIQPVRNYLLEAGVEIRGPRQFSEMDRRYMGFLWVHRGMRLVDIARKMECGRTTVSNELKKLGLQLTMGPRKKKPLQMLEEYI